MMKGANTGSWEKATPVGCCCQTGQKKTPGLMEPGAGGDGGESKLSPNCSATCSTVHNTSKIAGSEGGSVHHCSGSFSGVGVKMGVRNHEKRDASTHRFYERPLLENWCASE